MCWPPCRWIFALKDRTREPWQVTSFRAGNRDWAKLDTVIAALDSTKREKAKRQMEALANALRNFRSKRGFYVASDKQTVLVDLLTPTSSQTSSGSIPWHRPYQYQGERDRFTITWHGPDRTPNTADDIILKRP